MRWLDGLVTSMDNFEYISEVNHGNIFIFKIISLNKTKTIPVQDFTFHNCCYDHICISLSRPRRRRGAATYRRSGSATGTPTFSCTRRGRTTRRPAHPRRASAAPPPRTGALLDPACSAGSPCHHGYPSQASRVLRAR